MKALQFPGAFSVDIVIREWTQMSAAMEFRGFVYERKLNALSQYCYHQHFKVLLFSLRVLNACLFRN